MIARLHLHQTAEAQEMLFDPYALDAVWRLLTFNEGADADASLVFPQSIEAITSFAPLPERPFVRISGTSATGLRVELFDAQGQECLCLEGVRLVRSPQAAAIVLGEGAYS
jgi:hypothetical protein